MNEIIKYYKERIDSHGPNYKGVDYGDPERQRICFEQLMKICSDTTASFSINDFGCGYGALYSYLSERGYDFKYIGFDITEPMICHAHELYGDHDNCRFTTDEHTLMGADYSVASGVFSIRLDQPDEAWFTYIVDTLKKIWELSLKGMSFNCLTSYSDEGKMRDYLYYADPCRLFDYCKTNFSRNVALLHDYEVYEFTILVRR